MTADATTPQPLVERPSLTERVHRSRLGPPIRTAASVTRVPGWRLSGQPAPAPPHRKRAMVRDAIERFRPAVFIETGTYRGDTLAVVRPLVRRSISIELDPTLHMYAVRRFRMHQDVTVLLGDSAALLPQVLAELEEPALLWLDGHYSGGSTAGAGAAPIMRELEAALSSAHPHVALVDDIRLFDGTDGYPTLAEVLELVAARRPAWTTAVSEDILRIHP
jgi:hypothetical protein